MRTSADEIAAFVRSRLGWIRKHQKDAPPARPVLRFETGDHLPYLGRSLPLEIVPGSARTVQVGMDLLGLCITCPTLTPHDRADAIELAVREWYRERAAEEIEARVAYWARIAGYGPRRVLVRDQRRRWGSCSRDRTLRFNWRLIMLEPRIIDYVVVHELVHLVRPHHRPSFWAEVEALLPSYRERRAALREAGAALPL